MSTVTKKDAPWLMRTYSGHSSARQSNALYRTNLAKGQTGLSVAFDLPTQTGYDADHPLARGEVGKVGVPISHLGDMDALLDGIPLDAMNTSMTINATAAWLLALYVAVAEKQGVARSALRGTTQNDIIKEYLSRGTYIFPPGPSMRLTTDMVAWTCKEIPDFNPTNVCSYHLQEAGATPVQEIAFVRRRRPRRARRRVRARRGRLPAGDLPSVVGRISFFVNAGIRLIEECCKMRAFTVLWDSLMESRYGVRDPKMRRFRYGVQVNSLGLTEAQPQEQYPQRIVLEMLAVVLSKDARAHRPATRLERGPGPPAALGPAGEPAHPAGHRLRDRPARARRHLQRLARHRREDRLSRRGGSRRARTHRGDRRHDRRRAGYVKRELVKSHVERLRAIERGDIKIVGLNCFQETAESPLTAQGAEAFLKVDPVAEHEQIERLKAHRKQRNGDEAAAALRGLADVAKTDSNVMAACIRCAHAGVTTGEWGDTLRKAFGEYRAPTGIDISTKVTGVKEREDALVDRVKSRSSSARSRSRTR